MLNLDTTPATDATASDVATSPATDATPVVAKPAKPVRAKRASKPAATPVVVAPAKPDSAAIDAECQRLRDIAAKYYNGASIAAHQRKPAKLAEYVARVSTPVQRIGPSGASTRDESGLALILSNAKRDGTFNPVSINLDLGIASRLASGGFVTVTGETFSLTKAGRERANLVVKRAA